MTTTQKNMETTKLITEFYESAFKMDDNFTNNLLLDIDEPVKLIVEKFKAFNKDLAKSLKNFSDIEMNKLNYIALNIILSDVCTKRDFHQKLMLDFQKHFNNRKGIRVKFLSDDIKALIYEYFNGEIAVCWNEFKNTLDQ